MSGGEIIITKEDLEGLSGMGVFLYRSSHKKPYAGTICCNNSGLPAIVLGDKLISLRTLDVLDFGCEEVIYVANEGI